MLLGFLLLKFLLVVSIEINLQRELHRFCLDRYYFRQFCRLYNFRTSASILRVIAKSSSSRFLGDAAQHNADNDHVHKLTGKTASVKLILPKPTLRFPALYSSVLFSFASEHCSYLQNIRRHRLEQMKRAGT